MMPLSSSPVVRRSLPALLVGSLLIAPSLGAQTERRTLSGDRVALFNIAGDVRVERGRGRIVEVEVTRRGPDANRLRIETVTVRGMPSLVVRYPDETIIYPGRTEGRRWGGSTQTQIDNDGTWGGRSTWSGRRVKVQSSGRGIEAWADVVVRVPDGQALDAYLLVGEMFATDVDGDLRLDVGSARVTAERTRGVLNVDAGSGGVVLRDVRASRLTVDNGSGSLSMDQVTGDDCRVDTGSGGVRGSGVACRRLDVDVGSGGVQLSDARIDDVIIDTGSGSVTLGLRTSPKSVSVESGSGSVTIELPSDFGASVDIDTGSGGISTDFAIRTNRVERNHLRGTIGDGNARVRVETGSGAVRLRRTDR
jgi:hypothetical protein